AGALDTQSDEGVHDIPASSAASGGEGALSSGAPSCPESTMLDESSPPSAASTSPTAASGGVAPSPPSTPPPAGTQAVRRSATQVSTGDRIARSALPSPVAIVEDDLDVLKCVPVDRPVVPDAQDVAPVERPAPELAAQVRRDQRRVGPRG